MNIHDANAARISLKDADVKDSRIESVTFDGGDLSGMIMQGCSIKKSSFKNDLSGDPVKMFSTAFRHCLIENVDWSQAVTSGLDLSYSTLRNSIISTDTLLGAKGLDTATFENVTVVSSDNKQRGKLEGVDSKTGEIMSGQLGFAAYLPTTSTAMVKSR